MQTIVHRSAAAPRRLRRAKAAPTPPPPKLVGYARVSTAGQDLAAQEAALRQAGATVVFGEKISSRTAEKDRHALQQALAALRPGDTLVVAKLDRLGRTQHEVICRLHDLQEQGIHVRTLDGLIHTEALGKMAPLVIGLLTGLAEVERSLIQERTLESIAHRRATGGNLGGRPRSFRQEQVAMVHRLKDEGSSLTEIARAVGLSRSVTARLAKLAPAAT